MRRRGFTLLEMLIAIGLTMGLLAAMFSFLWDLLATRQRIIDETARRRAVDTLIERIERDLLTAVVGDRTVGAGVTGDESEISILSRAVPVRLAERGGNLGFLDLERSTFRFDASSDALTAQRAVIRSRGNGTAPGGREDPAPLGGIVDRVQFRYHDGQAWVDSFDSLRAGRFPLAVEIAVWFDAPLSEAFVGGFEREGASDDEPFTPADRLTFDTDAGFDERAFAIESDLDDIDEPPPDRVRVIGLADATDESAEVDAPEDEEAPR